MLDQTIASLLSTVLGGFLTIVGGFIAIYFTQHMTNKAEKKRLALVKIEEAYILTYEVTAGLRSYVARIGREIISSENLQVDWQFNEDFLNTNYLIVQKLGMVIQLYFPEIQGDFKEFSISMRECLNSSSQIGVTRDRDEFKNIIAKVEEAHSNMNLAIAKLIEKV
ncbi:hypothetical protein KDH_27600 [Dictyobacter sp. S3.2.2.5]|uniref:DUF4760 domain-containing protein n=1 Tax=Dictyobacter halimunensis TaxID=3026934 RepID=A0ABQ6FTW5_9CHLR|nr:hypothetical protein KDH_27600 [Dictyobacter sp. S3.2.2.5]